MHINSTKIQYNAKVKKKKINIVQKFKKTTQYNQGWNQRATWEKTKLRNDHQGKHETPTYYWWLLKPETEPKNGRNPKLNIIQK